MPSRLARCILGWVLTVLGGPGLLGAVAGTRHDLSTNSSPADTQVCVYCHTPHLSNTTLGMLWNRALDPGKTYVPYASPTMNTSPGDPKLSSSFLCLSCHDGSLGSAVVNGFLISDKHDLVNAPGHMGVQDVYSNPNCERCHPDFYGGPPARWFGGRNDRTISLEIHHPIAMTYPTSAQDPDFKVPPDLLNGWADVKLFKGKIECASCHNPHDAALSPFLRMSNSGSSLCLRCHSK
ncbi:MAG: cytochrome c3 family protein [Acidobacteria bacterium]|nr:cytochrome c3 family protein [Acidobacteriota bacterium]